jgi:hypothetical protein
MGRKRLKNRLKRRVIRYGTKGMPKERLPKAQNNPFDAPWFWLNLAAIDFCGFFGLGAADNTGKQPQPGLLVYRTEET